MNENIIRNSRGAMHVLIVSRLGFLFCLDLALNVFGHDPDMYARV